MNNNKINKKGVAMIATLFALIILIFIGHNFLSMKSVEFNLSANTDSVVIYKLEAEGFTESNAEVVSKLESSNTLKLKPGSYFVIPSGENISNDPLEIIIEDKTTSVDIDPFFSSDYLAKEFSSEIPIINSVLSHEYFGVINSDYIPDGQFYHHGDWYSATIYPVLVSEKSTIDTYAVIMHKVNDKWTVAAPPEILFTYKDYPNIPRDIVNKTNRSINTF